MSSSGQAPTDPPPIPHPQTYQTLELLKFLREENTANRIAVRQDSDATRSFLQYAVKLVAIPLSLLLVVAGVLGWRSIEDVKHTIEAEARRDTQTEITLLHGEIEKRLSHEFETPALQQTIKDASKTIVVTAVNKQVGDLAGRMALLQTQITETGEISNAGARLRLGFRPALDTLVEKMKSSNSYVSQYARSTLYLIGSDYDSSFSMGYGNPSPLEGARRYFQTLTPLTLRYLMDTIKTDKAAQMVAAAFVVFRDMTSSKIQTFDIPEAEKWCAEHRPKCE
jgi:hypothetical protein